MRRRREHSEQHIDAGKPAVAHKATKRPSLGRPWPESDLSCIGSGGEQIADSEIGAHDLIAICRLAGTEGWRSIRLWRKQMVTLLPQKNLMSLVQPMILRILDFGLIERLGLDIRRAFWVL
jgi:hypothetical protein